MELPLEVGLQFFATKNYNDFISILKSVKDGEHLSVPEPSTSMRENRSLRRGIPSSLDSNFAKFSLSHSLSPLKSGLPLSSCWNKACLTIPFIDVTSIF